MGKGLRRGSAAALVALIVAGCDGSPGTGSTVAPGPVGVGRSVDELKGAPCACAEIPMAIPLEARA